MASLTRDLPGRPGVDHQRTQALSRAGGRCHPVLVAHVLEV